MTSMVNNSNSEIDKLLLKEERIRQDLQKELDASKERTKSLLHTKLMLSGNLDDYSNKSIPDLLELIFRKYGKQHVDQAKGLLESEFGRQADKQTISGALIRYANSNKRFTRVGKNIFDVIKKEK